MIEKIKKQKKIANIIFIFMMFLPSFIVGIFSEYTIGTLILLFFYGAFITTTYLILIVPNFNRRISEHQKAYNICKNSKKPLYILMYRNGPLLIFNDLGMEPMWDYYGKYEGDGLGNVSFEYL